MEEKIFLVGSTKNEGHGLDLAGIYNDRAADRFIVYSEMADIMLYQVRVAVKVSTDVYAYRIRIACKSGAVIVLAFKAESNDLATKTMNKLNDGIKGLYKKRLN